MNTWYLQLLDVCYKEVEMYPYHAMIPDEFKRIDNIILRFLHQLNEFFEEIKPEHYEQISETLLQMSLTIAFLPVTSVLSLEILELNEKLIKNSPDLNEQEKAFKLDNIRKLKAKKQALSNQGN